MTHADCRFDPAAHAYTINGRPVPSVTQVLADLLPCWRASDWHMERGRAVHACAALIARGVEFTADEQIAGQVAALRRFVVEVKPLVLAVECPVFSERYQYAGTFDLLTRRPGKLPLMLVDYKSALTPVVPYQLAAYAAAYVGEVCIGYGMGVEIHDDGTYKLSEVYDLRRYAQSWLALLTSYGVRRKCGIGEAKEE